MVKKINEFKELQKKKGKKGFSMIELIIVLAIMAILVALIGTQLIPYLEKSREKRDGTTLDTIMTAISTVATEDETLTITNNASITDIIGSNANAERAFEQYSGLKLTDMPFKSDKSEDASGNAGTVGAVTVQVDSNDVIIGVTINGLSVDREIKTS